MDKGSQRDDFKVSCHTPLGIHMPHVIEHQASLYLSFIHHMQPRLVLVLLYMMSKNLVWVLEQPRNSLLVRHRRFEWFVNHVATAARQD